MHLLLCTPSRADKRRNSPLTPSFPRIHTKYGKDTLYVSPSHPLSFGESSRESLAKGGRRKGANGENRVSYFCLVETLVVPMFVQDAS